MDASFSVGVVLPAAGCGERMKLQVPKQFCEVNRRPLICYTIDCFHRLPWVHQIVISTSAEHVELLKELTSQYSFNKVTVVEGGTTRHRSICAAVKALQQVDPNTEVVVIHDAVRPFVSSDMLEKIAAAAYTHGAAGVCRPLVSTVIARDGDQRLTESLDRSRYFNSEMPQAFQVSLIAKAYSMCTRDDFDFGTECLLLAMKYGGVKAQILDGNADLWKVTYKKDLFAAEAVLKERFTRVEIINKKCWSELVDCVSAHLASLQLKVIQPVNFKAGDAQSASNGANTFVILHTHFTSPAHKDIYYQNIDRAISEDANKNSASRESIPTSRNSSKEDGDTENADCVCTEDITTVRYSAKDDSKKSRNALISCATTSSSVKKDNSTENVNVLNSDAQRGDVNLVNGLSDNALVETQSSRLLDRMVCIQNEWIPSHSGSQLTDCTFVHVFVASTETEAMESQMCLSRTILKLSKACRENGVLVYGVLASREVSADQVGQMTASIIQRGHHTFSGQLFLAA